MFNIAFIIVSILLIVVILLQQKSAGLGALMGGGGGEEIAQTRRGADNFLHKATVILSILFFAGGFYAMFWI